MIVDLAEARAFARGRMTGRDLAAAEWINELADEVESLERALVAMRAELAGMKERVPPVAARQQRAAKLRADAKYWARVAAEEIDGEKKAMAEELARSLSEQAKEVDL